MNYELELREKANQNITEASIYYEEQQVGLGIRFLDCVDEYLRKILRNPNQYPEKNPPFREAYLQDFPYLIIYQIIADKIIVYLVFNAYQDPEKKY